MACGANAFKARNFCSPVAAFATASLTRWFLDHLAWYVRRYTGNFGNTAGRSGPEPPVPHMVPTGVPPWKRLGEFSEEYPYSSEKALGAFRSPDPSFLDELGSQ